MNFNSQIRGIRSGITIGSQLFSDPESRSGSQLFLVGLKPFFVEFIVSSVFPARLKTVVDFLQEFLVLFIDRKTIGFGIENLSDDFGYILLFRYVTFGNGLIDYNRIDRPCFQLLNAYIKTVYYNGLRYPSFLFKFLNFILHVGEFPMVLQR